MRVEIWSDVVCPWCYLGKRRFEKALAQFPSGTEVQVVHRSFQLDPSAPTDHVVEAGPQLAAKYGRTPEQWQQLQDEMVQRAAADGLEFHLDAQQSGNTEAAHRLVHLARSHDRGDELIERLFRAHFTEQRSVFDAGSLARIAAEAGLDEDEAAAVLASDAYRDDVAADLEQAREYGITGVPFFVIDGRYGISGAQPTEVFSQALEQAHDAAVAARA